MTDQTNARAEAIELVAAKIYEIHGPLSTDEDGAESDAQDVIDALLARPEVLRALAGAPTADVASTDEQREADRSRVQAVLDAHAGPTAKRAFARLHAAAPEGVDAADELNDLDDAEAWLRHGMSGSQHRALAELLVAEYDKRGRAVLDGFYERAAQHRELTAAQAAIQRVRGEAASAVNAWSAMNEADRIFVRRYAPPLAAALDGDTTEEED